mmetsp:Transcript_9498/g.9057  ORF Transcript_9498/g.9057 Transcript_9498/m.9057 type:complete len:532 (+) Transcript_9498:3-1598(+)
MRIDILDVDVSVGVGVVLDELVQLIVHLGVELFHVIIKLVELFLGFGEDVLVDGVLEVGAESESESVLVLERVELGEFEGGELLQVDSPVSESNSQVDDGIEIVGVCLVVGFFCEVELVDGLGELGEADVLGHLVGGVALLGEVAGELLGALLDAGLQRPQIRPLLALYVLDLPFYRKAQLRQHIRTTALHPHAPLAPIAEELLVALFDDGEVQGALDGRHLAERTGRILMHVTTRQQGLLTLTAHKRAFRTRLHFIHIQIVEAFDVFDEFFIFLSFLVVAGEVVSVLVFPAIPEDPLPGGFLLGGGQHNRVASPTGHLAHNVVIEVLHLGGLPEDRLEDVLVLISDPTAAEGVIAPLVQLPILGDGRAVVLIHIHPHEFDGGGVVGEAAEDGLGLDVLSAAEGAPAVVPRRPQLLQPIVLHQNESHDAVACSCPGDVDGLAQVDPFELVHVDDVELGEEVASRDEEGALVGHQHRVVVAAAHLDDLLLMRELDVDPGLVLVDLSAHCPRIAHAFPAKGPFLVNEHAVPTP